jgi:hypothetical protein
MLPSTIPRRLTGMRAQSIAVFLTFALAGTAGAQGQKPKFDPADAKPLVSSYELANADSSLTCAITLDAKPAGPGLFLTFDRAACTANFGFLSRVVAWVPGVAGAILLIGSDGRTITEFTEGVGGVYEAIRENDAVYFLANLQFVDPSQRVQIADVFGEWNISLPDKGPICRITLTEDIAGNETFNARLASDCDAGVIQFGPAFWQLERGDIVLRNKNGDVLRFERHEGNIWAKVPEKPRPLQLSRP